MADSPNSFGQYKDFTNICGTAFQPFVAQQIEKRKELVSQEIRTNETLQWLNNKSSWVKVSSGVDVDLDNQKFIEKGDQLAKKYTLQAGLMDHSEGKNTFELRSGIGPDNAYGIGGTDFGYRPMPGITNLSISTGGRLGTLREATIDFVCYNKEQLDIMDALYMKLGMSVLVEWGHIPFIRNDGRLEVNPQPLPFYKIHSKEDLMVKIQEKRVEHFGNYDAMWGTIKNWSFSLEDNGTFKCQTVLVGAGDILESLKINQSGVAKNVTNEVTGSPYPVVTNANLSILNNALYDIFSKDIFTTIYGEGTQLGNFDYSLEYVTSITKYLQNLPKFTFGSNFETDPNSFCPSSPLIQHGYQYSLISGLNTRLGNGNREINIPKLDPKKVFSRYILPYEINGEGVSNGSINNTDKGAEQVYITLGHLLLLVLATGGIFDQTGEINHPYIYIDVNPDTNRCYTFPGHISLDPTVCLIGSQTLPFHLTSDMFNALRQEFPFHDSLNPTMGRFMYTLVNINFITTVLKNNTSQNNKGDVYFIDFIQELLTGINKATGGYNDYRIVPDDDTRCIRIFDDRRTIKPLQSGEASPYTIIPVLGKDSLAYNFNYTSRISPNTATMTVISSQAEPTGVNISNEALSFSKLREGLTNRLSPVRVGSTDSTNRNNLTEEEVLTAEQQKNNNFIELRDFIKGIYNATGGDMTEAEEEARRQSIVNPNPYYSYNSKK